MFAEIIGTGHFLPSQKLTNEDLEQRCDTSSKWISDRTGIQSRQVATKIETNSYISEHASWAALKDAGIKATDLDLVILGTTTPEKIFPATACLLQARLGAVNAFAFDVQAVCSGFVFALSIAEKFIAKGMVKHALVVGADIFTNLLDWGDRNTCVLFGDGAGAAVLSASTKPGILSDRLYSDGRSSDILHVPGTVRGGSIANGEGFIQMDGKSVFRFAVNALLEVAHEVLDASNLSVEDVDWFIPHQANVRIIETLADKLGVPMVKFILTLQHCGNTSAASVPITLDVGRKDGRIKKGNLVMLLAVGGGMTWGATLLRL